MPIHFTSLNFLNLFIFLPRNQIKQISFGKKKKTKYPTTEMTFHKFLHSKSARIMYFPPKTLKKIPPTVYILLAMVLTHGLCYNKNKKTGEQKMAIKNISRKYFLDKGQPPYKINI